MAIFVITMSKRITIDGEIDNNWYDAHATFYGDMTGSETMRKYNYISIASVGEMIEFSCSRKFLINDSVQFYYLFCVLHVTKS